jgi:hypothetical protein
MKERWHANLTREVIDSVQIGTPDGKKWIYDSDHHEWIDVSMNAKLRELARTSVRVK